MAMTLRPAADDDRLIEELARSQGVSKHEGVLRAVRDAAERTARRDRLNQSTDRVIDRYGDLLRRLGE